MATVAVITPLPIDQLKSRADGKVRAIVAETRDRYLAPDGRPWIIGYSGGKDSTLVCQVVFEALLQVPPARRTRPVYVLSSDTQVETPYIVDFVTQSTQLM